MVSHRTSTSEPRRVRTISAQLAVLDDRLEAAERQQRQLKNTVAALGRELGISVGCPCGRCEESYMLVGRGSMYCPRCGHRRTV